MNRSATIAITSVAAAVSIACSIATGQWTSPKDPDPAQASRTAVQPTPLAQAASATQARLGAHAEIETVTYYTLCGHKIIARKAAGAELIGKSRSEIAALYPDAKIISFSNSLVSVEYSVPLHCPQHFILRQTEQGLGVYQTIEATQSQTEVAKFNLNTAVLSADIQQMLKDGMVFGSLGEIEAYLEDLDS